MSHKTPKPGRRAKPRYTASTPIKCDRHNVETTWGQLDDIQQLAVLEGIDAADDLPCLLLPRQPLQNRNNRP